jgi:hypothetical protein
MAEQEQPQAASVGEPPFGSVVGYRHTQQAPLHLILYALAAMLAVVGWLCRDQPPVMFTQWAVAAVVLSVAFMFRHLTVCDEGDCLAVCFGPLPVFRRRVPYADVTSVEPSRSTLIDGWGVHWIPGRGTTYNLWGFGCVEVVVRGKVLRIGTDDVENLAAFLQSKLRQRWSIASREIGPRQPECSAAAVSRGGRRSAAMGSRYELDSAGRMGAGAG